MKNVKRLAVPVVIVLVVLIAVISFVSYKNGEIDLTEYIEVDSVFGLNGQGEIQYGLNVRDLSQVLLGEISDEEITDENFEEIMAQNLAKYDEADRAIDCIKVTADKEIKLSNGDVVTITASFLDSGDLDLPYHFKDASIEYTVSGLREGNVLDAFADGVISVSFDGFTGSGEAAVSVQASEEIYNSLWYEVSPSTGLSNGDTVTVSVAYSAVELETLGYFYPEITEKTFTVEGLKEYLTLDDTVPASSINEMQQMLMDQMQEEANGDVNEYNILTKAPEIMGSYFASTGDSASLCTNYWYGLEIQNAVIILGHYTIENIGFFPTVFQEWSGLLFPNCSLDDAGNLIYEENVTSMAFSFETKDEFAAWFQEEFPGMTITELN